MKALPLVLATLATSVLAIATLGCDKKMPITLVGGGGAGSSDGWSYTTGSMYLVSPEPGMLFGTLKTPTHSREFSYLILFRHKVGENAPGDPFEHSADNHGEFRDNKLTIRDGISINGSECKILVELHPDKTTQRFAVDTLTVNGVSADPNKGILFLVDLTTKPASVKQIATSLPSDLPDPMETEAVSKIVKEAMQQLKASNPEVRSFFSQ